MAGGVKKLKVLGGFADAVAVAALCRKFSAVLYSYDWTSESFGGSQIVELPKIKAHDSPMIDVETGGIDDTQEKINTIDAWNNVFEAEARAGQIIFRAREIPTVDIPLKITVIGGVEVSGDDGSEITTYSGEYEVTPSPEAQTLDTALKIMSDDVTINKIPYYEVSNNSGGDTVYIGSEIEIGG